MYTYIHTCNESVCIHTYIHVMKVMIMIIREASMTVQNYVPTFKLLRIPKYKFKFRERTAI